MKKRTCPPWQNWSASKLELLLFTCPLCFFFTYVIKIDSPPNISGVFGEAIHRMAKSFFSLKYKSERSFIKAWSHYWWREILAKKCGGVVKEKDPGDCKKFFATGVKILRRFYQDNVSYRNLLPRPAAEKRFSIIFRGHRITGAIDRIQPFVTGEVELWDYKTGLRKPTEPELARDIQFTIYNLAYLMDHGKNPDRMYLMHLPSGEKISIPLRAEADYQQLGRFLDEARTYVKNILMPLSSRYADLPFRWLNPEDIERQHFSPRSSPFCSICDHEHLCRKFRPQESAREIWVRRELERTRFYGRQEQLILPFEKGGENETVVVGLS